MSPSFCKQLIVACLLAFISSAAVSAEDTCKSIAEIACELDELTTLCELISASEPTTNALTNEVFTLFAPTDEAWLDLDVEVIDDLVNCTSALNSVFAFHTIYGTSILSSDLTCGETTTMSSGDNSRTVCTDDKIYQKGSLNSRDQMPEIVAMDIAACNGVVHLVDQVMLPKEKYIAVCEDEQEEEEDDDDDEESPARPENPAEDLPAEEVPTEVDIIAEEVPTEVDIIEEPITDDNSTEVGCSVSDVICADDDLTVICDLLSEFEVQGYTYYELMNDIAFCSEWTVFAPTDDAFDAMEEFALGFGALSAEQISYVLTFHAIQFTALGYDDLICQEKIVMANGEESRTKCDKDDETGEGYKIQKGAGQLDGMLPRIIEANIEACNGVIHKIDNVMIPNI